MTKFILFVYYFFHDSLVTVANATSTLFTLLWMYDITSIADKHFVEIGRLVTISMNCYFTEFAFYFLAFYI